MKHLKTILLSLFTIITATEMSYPIILTGPGRRQAHKKQTEEAYAAGLASSDPALAENYADDAVVQIQAVGDGSFLAKFKTATPEERAALKANATPEQLAALQARANSVKTQAISSNDNQNEDYNENDFNGQSEDSAVYQALQDAGLDDDLEASNVAIQAVESEEKAAEALTPVVQTVQAVSSSVSPLIKRTQTSATPVAKAQVTPIISSTAVPLVATAQIPQAAPVSPAPEVKTIESTKPSEQTASKIIKIYPVYDAIGSAIRHIYSAAQNMMNYAYNLVTTSMKPAVSDVKTSITEK